MSRSTRSTGGAWLRRFVFAAAMCFLPMVSATAAWAGVNVNTAPASQLESLPGIGPSKAAAIVAYRTEHGAFTSIDSLQAVPGIGAKTWSPSRRCRGGRRDVGLERRGYLFEWGRPMPSTSTPRRRPSSMRCRASARPRRPRLWPTATRRGVFGCDELNGRGRQDREQPPLDVQNHRLSALSFGWRWLPALFLLFLAVARSTFIPMWLS